MASFIDLENEDLLAADENELFGLDDDSDHADPIGLITDGQEPANNNEDAKNATRIAPKKKVVKNPQPKLDADKLKGPRGLIIMEEWFKYLKFKGNGYEKEDLNTIMTRLEQWTHRLFPKFTFDDSIARIEKLGHKKPVINFVRRIRLDLEENYSANLADEQVVGTDPFDLLNGSTQQTSLEVNKVPAPKLTDEQRERMLRNRLLAEERRQARAREREAAEVLAPSQSND